MSEDDFKDEEGNRDDNDPEDEDFDPEDIFGSVEALNNIAKMGLTVFRAVLRDGGSWNEAFSVTSAFFAGMTKATAEDE